MKEEDACESCVVNYFLSEGKCVSNPLGVENCAGYDGDKNCSQCLQGHYLTLDKACLPTSLIPNCQFYSGEDVCVACNSGYYLYDQERQVTVIVDGESVIRTIKNQCLLRQYSNCDQERIISSFENNIISTCDVCEKTYKRELVSGSSNQYECNLVTDDTCVEYDPIGCSVCERLFYLDSSKTCQAAQSIANCLVYESNLSCKVCEEGYTLKDDLKSCSNEIFNDSDCSRFK